MASHNLANININDEFTIIGYSVAGEETVVAIPELDVCFDIGKAPEQIIPINNVLLTHGHIDHTSGIAYYLSHRQFCGQAPGNVLIPEQLKAPLEQILDGWGRLDGNEVPCNIVGVKDGSEFKVKPNIKARVFKTAHNWTSVGYCILETRKKLKEKFHGLRGPEIVELKKQGVEIENRIEMPLVTYLGDTSAADYSALDYVKKSRILITECTFFIDEHKDRAKAGKHTHVDQLADMLMKLDNEYVVLTHFTQRTHIIEARKLLDSKLSPELAKKVVLLMDFRGRNRGAKI